MELATSTQLIFLFIVLSLVYCAGDFLLLHRLLQKQPHFYLVGRPSRLLPRFILNLIYAFDGVQVLEKGYQKFRHRAHQHIRGDGAIVILPLNLIEELSSLPSTLASPQGALENDLLGSHTGLNLILESRLHHSIVQRKLTPRLPALTPYLEEELTAAVQEYIPVCDEWTEIQPFRLLGQVAARLTARALVGPEFCRNKTWLDVSVNYTENMFQTIVILRLFPSWMHSFLSHLLPSYWSGKAYLRTGTELLSPKIADLIHKNDKGTWSPGENVDDVNVLSWLADTAKGKDRDPGTLAHVEVLLALASVHTTLLRMVNVLYDLTCHPEYLPGLHEEIETERETGWNASSYTKLRKLDSVLRESQRISPPTILGMKRLFKQDFTFANGLHIRKGTYVCMPTFAIENDASNTSKPQEFDGLRSYRLREELGDPNREEHQFSSYEKTVLNFGYGKAACPGRYFASLILKMVFVKLLTEYDFEFLPNTGRPKNVVLHEFLFPWPWDRILIRKKRGHSSPF